jgi:FkbM family methyltransferase
MTPLLYIAGKLNPKWYYRLAQLRYKLPLVGTLLSKAGNRIRNRDGTIQNGFGKGLRFNVGASIAGYLLGTQEPQVQAAITHLVRPGMIVYDVGANVGFLTLLFAKAVGKEGCVIAFEPVAANSERIGYNAKLNGFTNIIVRLEAVGGSDGTAGFTIGAFPTIGKLQQAGASSSEEVREVPVRSLDSVIKELPPPDLLKIDIEGAEVDCLCGARSLLKENRPLLLIELHATNQAVAEILRDSHYASLILGSDQSITEGHWNVQILAYPIERPLPSETRRLLTDPGLTPWR